MGLDSGLAGINVPVNPIDEEHRSENARDALEELLDKYGLGSLTTWAWDQIVSGVSDTELALLIREREEFQERFPAIKERENNGKTALSPDEYLAWEQQAYQVMRASGLPAGFYDDRSDFTAIIAADMSVQEFEGRITQGFQKVAQTDPKVRDAFRTYFGVDGDAALAAYYLDPSKDPTKLLEQASVASVGGAGSRLGFNISKRAASSVADVGVTSFVQAQQGFRQLDQVRSVFTETVSERGNDLDVNREGIAHAFGTDGEGAGKVRKRLDERAAAFEGGGGAAQTRGGTGLGSA